MRSILLLSLLAAPLHAAQATPRTWIVDFFEAGDADFAIVQEAVDAAADGDTILIRPGAVYDGFTVVDKALVITAEEGSRVAFEFGDRIEVRDLSAGKTLLLRGMGADGAIPQLDPTPLFDASDCEGTLWIEDCFFSPQTGDPLYAPLSEPALTLTSCLSVVLLDSRMRGAPAARSSASGVHALGSTFEGVAGPQAGLEMAGSFSFLSGCTVAGGPGVLSPYGSPCVSDGGPGIGLTNASELYTQDTSIQGGPIDPTLFLICAIFGNNSGIGTPGPPIEQDPASTVASLPGSTHTTTTTPLARDGATLTRTFRGEPGELVYCFEADATEPVFEALVNGSVFTPAGTPFTLLGSLDGTGSLLLTFPAVLAATLDGTSFAQALFLDGGGVTFAGSPSSTTVLGAGVVLRTGPDCNRNGIADDEDLALGTSLDCNRDGTPDECQPFTPVTTQRIAASDGRSDDGFGLALAMDGSTLAVGAPMDRPPGTSSLQERGSVYLFERAPDGSWQETQKLSFGGTGSVHFGAAVALEGDTLVVGIPEYTDFSTPFFFQGRADVYERDGAGTWAFAQTLEIPLPRTWANFGRELVLQDGELLIAAPIGSGGSSAGATVHAYRKIAGVWTLVETLPPAGTGPSNFGLALALDAGTLAIASSRRPSLAKGSVDLYELQGGLWTRRQTITSDDVSGIGERFGRSLDLRGDVLVVGADLKSHASIQDGVAYAYERSGAGVWQPATAGKLVPFGIAASRFGSQVAAGSDLLLASTIRNGSLEPRLALFPRRPDGRWPRYASTVVENEATVDAILPVGEQLLLGVSTGDGARAGSGVVLVYELDALHTPDPCLLGGPTRTRRAPSPLPR